MKIRLIYRSCFLLVSILLLTNSIVFSYTPGICNAEPKDQPKISVIVPVYNAQLYLEECVDSIINQTLRDIEIICINDGSKDNSLDLLYSYAKKDSRVFVINQVHQGVSATRNNGLSLASGEYVAFVDSDDYLDPNAYEIAYSEAKKNDLDILNFGWKAFPEETSWDKWKSCPKEKMFYGDSVNAWFYCKIGANVNIWNKLYRRSFLINSAVNFEPRLGYGEDLYFNFLLFPTAKIIKFIPNQLYHYRRDNKGSAINNLGLEPRLQAQINIIKLMVGNWTQNGYTREMEHRLLEFFIDWTSYAIFKVKDQQVRCRFVREFFNALGDNIYNLDTRLKLNAWAGGQLKELEDNLKV